MVCTTVREGSECIFMSKRGCQFKEVAVSLLLISVMAVRESLKSLPDNTA